MTYVIELERFHLGLCQKPEFISGVQSGSFQTKSASSKYIHGVSHDVHVGLFSPGIVCATAWVFEILV